MNVTDGALARLERLLDDADERGDTFGMPGIVSTQAVRECLRGGA